MLNKCIVILYLIKPFAAITLTKPRIFISIQTDWPNALSFICSIQNLDDGFKQRKIIEAWDSLGMKPTILISSKKSGAISLHLIVKKKSAEKKE